MESAQRENRREPSGERPGPTRFAPIGPAVDLAAPDAFVSGVPHAFLATPRSETPRNRQPAAGYWQTTTDGSGFRNVTPGIEPLPVAFTPGSPERN